MKRHEVFYEQLAEVTRSADLVLMGDLDFLYIHRKYNTVQKKLSRRFLERAEDSFLTQLVKETTRGGALLDLLFTERTGGRYKGAVLDRVTMIW